MRLIGDHSLSQLFVFYDIVYTNISEKLEKKKLENLLTFTITLYLSKAIMIMVHIDVFPKSEPVMAYSEHAMGPTHTRLTRIRSILQEMLTCITFFIDIFSKEMV